MKGSRTKKVIRIVLPIVVVLVLIGGYAWFYNLTRAPLPQHDGELRVAGLNDTVEILRDEWGIPQIYASSLHDLFRSGIHASPGPLVADGVLAPRWKRHN